MLTHNPSTLVVGRTLTDGFERRLENHLQAVCDQAVESAYQPVQAVRERCLGIQQGYVDALRYIASELAVAGDKNACVRITQIIDQCYEQASWR